MPALVAGIHVLSNCAKQKDVDCRNKSGHDELTVRLNCVLD
jgi:hypothetical protein